MTAVGINNPNSLWMREYNGRNGGLRSVDFGTILDEEAKQRVADTTAMAIERMKAEKLTGLSDLSDFAAAIIDGFNAIADMTPEMERAMNEMIERGEK